MARTLFISYLRRGAGVWVGVRLLAAVAAFMSGGALLESALLHLEPSPSIVIGVAILGLVDVRLAREQTLIGNLGLPLPMVAIPIGAAALIGELALGLIGVVLL